MTIAGSAIVWGDINTENSKDAMNSIRVSAAADTPAREVEFSLEISANEGKYTHALPMKVRVDNAVTISGVKNTDFLSRYTYHVTGNLVIIGNVSMEPGTVVKVDPGVDIQVGLAGFTTNFSAVGTADAPIIFTSVRPYGHFDIEENETSFIASNFGPRNEAVVLYAYKQVRYISETTGTDSPTAGTLDNPWRSIEYALSRITNASLTNRYALLVAAGTYTGTGNQVVMMKPWIDLYGGFEPVNWKRDIHANLSIIDGENLRSAVIGANNARLDGFTVMKSTSSGVVCSDSSPTIVNNRIIGNGRSIYGYQT